jgi:hypothetical protein
LTIYVLFKEDQQILDSYERLARELMDRFDTSAGFAMPEVVLVSVAALSTAIYLSTAPLDLDHLSLKANDRA